MLASAGPPRPPVQRMPIGCAPVVVQRMAVNGTDWDGATKVEHSKGGGIGVLVFGDGGRPVVVKAGEDFLAETNVAAKALSLATAGARSLWTAQAPQARPVDAAEAQKIKARAEALPDGATLQTPRTQGLLADLAALNGVLVYGFAEGVELQEAFGQPQTEGGKFGMRSLRAGSVSQHLLYDAEMMTMFGRAAAADIMLGNADRFVGKINLENVMVDVAAKSISLIDNVEASDRALLPGRAATPNDGEAGVRRLGGLRHGQATGRRRLRPHRRPGHREPRRRDHHRGRAARGEGQAGLRRHLRKADPVHAGVVRRRARRRDTGPQCRAGEAGHGRGTDGFGGLPRA
jgi:hypothetical protein